VRSGLSRPERARAPRPEGSKNPPAGHPRLGLGALAALSLCGMLLLALSACNRSTAKAVTATGESTAPGNAAATLFTVPQNQMAHVQIVQVKTSSIPHVLRLPGSVAYNEFETTPVITQVSGPVARVMVVPGQHVTRGQMMLEVSSPDFAQDRNTYVKAREAYWLAQQSYSRAKDLYAHHAIAQADLQQAQTSEAQAKADLTAARQALRVLGIGDPAQVLKDAESPEIPVLAPISGLAVERMVSPGQVVQAGATQCFTISNMSTVWVLANVYQNDLSYIRVGEPVAIETGAYPMKFRGRISYIAPAMDPTTRTLQVRIVTRNPGERLKKDMYVTVVVNAGVIRRALTVPDSAVLRNSENQPFVYVVAAPQQFAQRLVTIGANQDGRTQILRGVRAGEQVVADGSLFLEFASSFEH
jgi:cobalt-zinc-cadmium efflux system membrane fusion protein